MRNTTFDKIRQRYVFQIRVPRDIAKLFGSRTHIRVALGRIDETEATRRAQELTSLWTRKFDTARKRGNPTVKPQSQPVVRLRLGPENALRAVATCRLIAYSAYKEQLSLLRSGTDPAWANALAEANQAVTLAQQRLVLGRTDAALASIACIQSIFYVTLEHRGNDLNDFAEILNADAVQLANQWLDILKGQSALDALRPAEDTLLPLTRFFGSSANALVFEWRQRLELIGKAVRSKTAAKYESIIADFATVLEETPIEGVTKDHYKRLSFIWRERGNQPSTIAGKFSTIISLMEPMAPRSAALWRSMMPRTHLGRAKRLPFTAAQLGHLRLTLASKAGIYPDDLMLLDLMTLTGARLGELLQLDTTESPRVF